MPQYTFEKKCPRCENSNVLSVTKNEGLQLCERCNIMYKPNVIVPIIKLSPKTINVKKICDTLVLKEIRKDKN